MHGFTRLTCLARLTRTDLAVGELLAAHADDQEVLMDELTLFDGLDAAAPGKK